MAGRRRGGRRGGGDRLSGRPPEPPLPVAAGLAALFGGLSRARRRRIFHPDGAGFEARYSVLERPAARVDALALSPGFEHRAVVRLSRALGLPRPLPDALGLAVRLPDVYGEGRHQDFLLVSSGDGALLNHLVRPARAFDGWFSTLLPYRVARRRCLFGARADSPRAYTFAIAAPARRWRPVARIELGEPLPADESRALRFDPANVGGGIELAGAINALRPPAYRGSQAARL